MKHNYKQTLKLCLGIALAATSITANATSFQLDEFRVDRNGGLFFLDTFDNGDPADTGWTFANGNTAYYDTIPASGLVGPESGGKLQLNPRDGTRMSSPLTGQTIDVQRGRVISNMSNNPDNLHRGLKIDDSIRVEGIFDLVMPTSLRERFGVRLTDDGANQGLPIDRAEVDVRLRTGGVVVEFAEYDFPNSTRNILDSILLDAAALGVAPADFALYDQIGLILSRTLVAGGNPGVTGSFRLIDNDGILSDLSYNFGGSTTLFEGELWTRAEFVTVAQVSEPATLALLFGGLLGALRLRRRS